MASRSNPQQLEVAVSEWVAQQEPLLADQGYSTIHVDELVGEGWEVSDRLDVSLKAFAALIGNGKVIADHFRLLLSLPVSEDAKAVPLSDDRIQRLWSEIDLLEPPSLSIVDRTRDAKLFDEERYFVPLVPERIYAPLSGVVTCHYVATRSRLYRENDWNYVTAIVFEYFPE